MFSPRHSCTAVRATRGVARHTRTPAPCAARRRLSLKRMPRDLTHIKVIGASWALTVAGSVTYSLNTNKHLLLSQRMIHARLYAQFATVGALCIAGAVEANASFFQDMTNRISPPPVRARNLPRAEARHRRGISSVWSSRYLECCALVNSRRVPALRAEPLLVCGSSRRRMPQAPTGCTASSYEPAARGPGGSGGCRRRRVGGGGGGLGRGRGRAGRRRGGGRGGRGQQPALEESASGRAGTGHAGRPSRPAGRASTGRPAGPSRLVAQRRRGARAPG